MTTRNTEPRPALDAEIACLRARQRAESGFAACREMYGTDSLEDRRVLTAMAAVLREVRQTERTLSLRIVQCAEDQRVPLFYPGMPPYEVA